MSGSNESRVKKNKDQKLDPPIVIGALGGSGTRVVAEIIQQMGVYIGADLNSANDNLSFTYLFKRKSLWNASIKEFKELYDIFTKLYQPDCLFNFEELRIINNIKSVSKLKNDNKKRWYLERQQIFKTLHTITNNKYKNEKWGWKEPNTHIYLDRLYDLEPELKYIHVTRHGLDMAFSRNKRQLNRWGELILDQKIEINPYYALKYWLKVHERVENITKSKKKKYFHLFFDDLCGNPIKVIDELAEFLGIRLNTDDLYELSCLVKTPISKGRYKQHSSLIFDKADISKVKSLGFVIDQNWLNQITNEPSKKRLQSKERSVEMFYNTTITAKNNFSNKGLKTIGSVYDSSGRIIQSAKRQTKFIRNITRHQNSIIIRNQTARLNGTFLYLGHYTSHYGHFILETLSRFWSLELDLEYDKVIFHKFMNPKNIMEFSPAQICFDCFGIDPSKVIFVDQVIKLEKLIVPSSLVILKDKSDPLFKNTFKKIVKYCMQRSSVKAKARIYISRKLLVDNQRAVNNEEEVENLFRKNGFEVIYPEQIDFVDQVTLYNKASIIAGFTGSGMHNVLFCTPKTRLIIIGHPREPNAPHINQIVCNNLTKVSYDYITFRGKVNFDTKEAANFDIDHLSSSLNKILNRTAIKGFMMPQEVNDKELIAKAKHNKVVCVLGMHRSGTSNLAGALQASGLYGGDIINEASTSQPKGNRENRTLMKYNESILKNNNSTWYEPPTQIEWSDSEAIDVGLFIHEMTRQSNVWMFKDPRTLFTLPFWESLLSNIIYIGTFRNPMAVALSLYKRQPRLMPLNKGLELWYSYNKLLLNKATKYNFPIVCFDLEGSRYLDQLRSAIASIQAKLEDTIALDVEKALEFYEPEAVRNNIFSIEYSEKYKDLIIRVESLHQDLLKLSGTKIRKDYNINQESYQISLENPLDSLQKIVRREPENVHIHYIMGLMQLDKGNFNKAIAKFKIVLDNDPDNRQIAIKLCKILSKRKKWQDSILILKKLVAVPGNWKFHLDIAIAYFNTGDKQLAMEHCQQFIALNNGLSYNLNMQLANLLRELENYNLARTYYDQALAIDSQNSNLYIHYAVNEFKNETFSKCVEICERGLTVDNKNWKLCFHSGVSYSKLNQDEKAIFFLNEAIRHNKNLPLKAYLLLAKLYNKMGNKVQTLTICKKAKIHYPNNNKLLTFITKIS